MVWKHDDDAMKVLEEFSRDVRQACGDVAKEIGQIGREYGEELHKNVAEPLRGAVLKRITRADGTLHDYAQKLADNPRVAGMTAGASKGFTIGLLGGPAVALKASFIGATIGFFAGPDVKNWVLSGKPDTANDTPVEPPSPAESAPSADLAPEKRRKPQAFKIDGPE